MLSEANKMLEMRTEKIFIRMVDVDRRLRGKGYPNSVEAYDSSEELSEVLNFLDERCHAELAIIPRIDKTNELKSKPPELLQNIKWILL
jgi:hypothetical protein